MKVFLTGYMGSGKSTIGRRLAEKLNLEFIDFDKHIESRTGKTINEIFDTEGEEKFRQLEHNCLKSLLEKDQCVISLGGGTPCFYNNSELINQNGVSFYIEMRVADLVKRLSKAKLKRPLLRDLNETDLKFFIESHLEKRLPFYRQAHYSIPVHSQNIEEVAETIAALVGNK